MQVCEGVVVVVDASRYSVSVSGMVAAAPTVLKKLKNNAVIIKM